VYLNGYLMCVPWESFYNTQDEIKKRVIMLLYRVYVLFCAVLTANVPLSHNYIGKYADVVKLVSCETCTAAHTT